MNEIFHVVVKTLLSYHKEYPMFGPVEEAIHTARLEEQNITYEPSKHPQLIKVPYPQTDTEIIINELVETKEQLQQARDEIEKLKQTLQANAYMMVRYMYRLQKKMTNELIKNFNTPSLKLDEFNDGYAVLYEEYKDVDDIFFKEAEIEQLITHPDQPYFPHHLQEN